MAYDDPFENPFETPQAASQPTSRFKAEKESALGVITFGLGVFNGIASFALVVTAGVMATNDPHFGEVETPALILTGLGLLGVMGLMVVGTVLGIVSLFQSRRRKVLGIIGLILNVMELLGLGALMVIGSTLG